MPHFGKAGELRCTAPPIRHIGNATASGSTQPIVLVDIARDLDASYSEKTGPAVSEGLANIVNSLLSPNFMARGRLALPDFSGLLGIPDHSKWRSSMAVNKSSWHWRCASLYCKASWKTEGEY